jgi:hypothetical protein
MARATVKRRTTLPNGRKATMQGPIGKQGRPTNVQVAEASMAASRSTTDTWGLHRIKGGWELCAPQCVVPGDRLVGRDGWMIQV